MHECGIRHGCQQINSPARRTCQERGGSGEGRGACVRTRGNIRTNRTRCGAGGVGRGRTGVAGKSKVNCGAAELYRRRSRNVDQRSRKRQWHIRSAASGTQIHTQKGFVLAISPVDARDIGSQCLSTDCRASHHGVDACKRSGESELRLTVSIRALEKRL